MAAALLQQGRTRIDLSMYREAIVATERALEIYRELNDRDGIALALVLLSKVQVRMGNYKTVRQLIEQALEGISPESRIAAFAYGILGWARSLQGYYVEGLSYLERAIEYYSRAGDLRHRAHLLRRLPYMSMGKYEKAISMASRARDDFRTVGDVLGEAKSILRIGQARIAQGLFDEGIEYLSHTLESLKKIGDLHCEAQTLWYLGRAHCEAGRSEQGILLLNRSLKIVRTIGDLDDEFHVLIDIARLKIQNQNYEEALSAADRAIAIAEELQNQDGLGAALIERSRACLKLKELEEALKAAESGIRLLDETGSGERWRGYWALAHVLYSLGKREQALASLLRSVELVNEIVEQIDASDKERRSRVSQARSGPARDLESMKK